MKTIRPYLRIPAAEEAHASLYGKFGGISREEQAAKVAVIELLWAQPGPVMYYQ